MQFTDQEKDTELYRKLMAHFDGLLSKAQLELEKSSNTEVSTASIRGRIKLIRELQKLGNPTGGPMTAEQ